MHFMQLLRTLDEILYEVMSWLVFYVITLWRTVAGPLRMMNYANAELGDRSEQQYADTLPPPLFLLLTLLLSHAIELALVGQNPLIEDTKGLSELVHDDTSLLILRLLLFSLPPLIMAVRLVRAQKTGLTRDTLRQPFYSQCYLAAPFALTMGIASILTRLPSAWAEVVMLGWLLIVLDFLWYGTVQARWFAAKLDVSIVRGFGMATVGMIQSAVIFVILGRLFF
ncbi:hypothetical protein LZK98_10205 [Sphingomonas cannabina]|uniref:hypothetical protein n=1 Tax=Sphingomonas cannabina TaxID=2899123 RepID=UPI001F40250D|nr:hypothetical protein [Sphingomonas cannabina]UIJ47279.1 hypothetical protein LZK98_10205 [Sphingomonas cannabina]